MEYLKAFLVGGALCAIGQVLIEFTKLTPARILVAYVVSGVFLGAIGLYESLIDFAGAGASVPLTGFGYLLSEGVKTAIVGLGNIGKIHKRIIEKLGFDLVAICDANPNKAKEFEGVPFYTDYKKMLDEVRPNVVHICTPHYLHADMIIDALSRNINALCEKPLCINKQDIAKILEVESKSKATLGVCHQNRYIASNIYAKNYLADKRILGASGSVLWNRGKEYYSKSDWRGKWKTEGGGVLINQALHTLDLMQWVCGEPEKLIATVANIAHNDVIEVEDVANLFCFGKTDFSFFATTANSVDLPIEMVFKTEENLIKVYPDSVVIGNETTYFDKQSNYYGKPCYGSGHFNLISDFYDCLKTGKKFEIDGEESSKVIKIILSAYESNGKTVQNLDTLLGEQ